MAPDYVFGYGSLSAEDRGAPLAQATLAGYERVWDVAMDNTEAIPGYKFYVDPLTGERPPVHVTFLDIVSAPASACVGFLLAIATPSDLVLLDRRERNYDRVEVTERIISAQVPLGRVWTYVGTPAARERYAAAAAAGTAVIQSAYIAAVEAAYSACGLDAAYSASTRPPTCPIRDLTRVNDSSASGGGPIRFSPDREG